MCTAATVLIIKAMICWSVAFLQTISLSICYYTYLKHMLEGIPVHVNGSPN